MQKTNIQLIKQGVFCFFYIENMNKLVMLGKTFADFQSFLYLFVVEILELVCKVAQDLYKIFWRLAIMMRSSNKDLYSYSCWKWGALNTKSTHSSAQESQSKGGGFFFLVSNLVKRLWVYQRDIIKTKEKHRTPSLIAASACRKVWFDFSHSSSGVQLLINTLSHLSVM